MLPFALAGCTTLTADVIDFSTLPGNNADSFTSYSEDGFTVSATSGPWRVATLFGNPVPDVFCFLCSPGTLEITGRQFDFESVDLGNPGVPAFSYTITGYREGSQVLLQSGVNPAPLNSFATIASGEPSQLLDRLDITIDTASASTDGNVDNIVVNPVPEPGTRTVVFVLLGALAMSYRRYGAS
jgi:hypothetical protein